MSVVTSHCDTLLFPGYAVRVKFDRVLEFQVIMEAVVLESYYKCYIQLIFATNDSTNMHYIDSAATLFYRVRDNFRSLGLWIPYRN